MSAIRVAMLGTGGMMGAHYGRLKHRSDVEIVGLCDVSGEQTAMFIEKNIKEGNVPRQFTSSQQMYRELKPDGVYISTPHTLHYDQAVEALDAGVHVFMEKPMVTSSDHAYALAEHVNKSGKHFVVGYNTPCLPEFAYLRDQFRKGTFGKLEVICGFLNQNWLKGTIGTWRQRLSLAGGGEAYDSGAHLFNSLIFLVESPVAEVFAYIDNHGTEVDINSVMVIKFEHGVMASIAIGGNCNGGGIPQMTFMFERARVTTDPCGWDPFLDIAIDNRKLKFPPVANYPGTNPTENFIEVIQGKAEPMATVEHGILHSELMDAVYESARLNAPVKPKKRW